MGCNYYIKTECCKTCGHQEEYLHIGKSSIGWQFSFAGHPDKGIFSFNDWKIFIERNKCIIIDEYDALISNESFYELVKNKKGELNSFNILARTPNTQKEKDYLKTKDRNEDNRSFLLDCWKDDEGYCFTKRRFC